MSLGAHDARHAHARRLAPRHQRGAGGGADRVARVPLGEALATEGQPVERRRAGGGVASKPEVLRGQPAGASGVGGQAGARGGGARTP